MSGAPRKHTLARRIGAAVLAVVTAGAVVATTPVVAAAAGPGVCQGVARCRVVAHVDVNGDGSLDAVGVARRGSNTGSGGVVIVRVKTAAHTIVHARRKLDGWFGAPWHGAARLDRHQGWELVVGHVAGAHTEFFQALTWRAGKLVTLRAPGSDPDWVVDGAANVDLGWQRRSTDRIGTIRRLEANRNGTRKTFTATVTTYRWRPSGWQQVSHSTNRTLPEDDAETLAGFRGLGLPRF